MSDPNVKRISKGSSFDDGSARHRGRDKRHRHSTTGPKNAASQRVSPRTLKEKAAETRIIVKTMAEGANKKSEIEYRNVKVFKEKIAKNDQMSESEANQLSCLLSKNDTGNVRVVAEDLIGNIRSLDGLL